MIRIIISLINIAVGFFSWATAECFVLSLATKELPEKMYRLVDVTRVHFFGYNMPFYTCEYKNMLNVFIYNLKHIYLSLQIKFFFPFIIGLFLFLITYVLTARIPGLFYNRKTTLHGSSRWMTEKEMRKTGLLNNPGVVMGETADAEFKTTKNGLKLDRPGDIISHKGNNHTLIVGSTRSGKGVSCIIPTEFNWSDSMIVLDPKSEGWGISANYRSRFSYTFKFEPENPKQSIHYNPLLAIRRGRYTIPDIQNLANILIPENPNAKEPFWDNEARKLLSSVIGYIIYCEPPERKTFKQVYSIFTTPIEEITTPAELDNDSIDNMFVPDRRRNKDDDESAIKKYLNQYTENAMMYRKRMEIMPDDIQTQFENRHTLPKEKRLAIEAVAQQYLTQDDMDNLNRIQQDLAYFAGCEERQLSSVVSTMMSNLHVISDPNVQEVTDRSDFLMDDFTNGIIGDDGKRHPMSLYICVSLSSIKRLMPIIRIFYEQAITLLTRELKKPNFNLLLIFDEFYQMGRMEIVEKALSLSAGYGVLCAIVIQSYDQLQLTYQSEATFTDNFAYQVILRVNEQKTCQKISDMLGKETKRHKKLGTSGNIYALGNDSSNLNVDQIGRELMTAEEVRTMPEDTCLIFSSGNHPYKAKKIRYYLDDRFRRFYLDKSGNVLPAPDTPEKIEENQPHPDAVEEYTVTINGQEEKRTRRIGLDNEGWHLLLGFNGQETPIQLENMEEEEDSYENIIQEEELTGDAEEIIDEEELNEIDSQISDDEAREFLSVSAYPSQSAEDLEHIMNYFKAQREIWDKTGVA